MFLFLRAFLCMWYQDLSVIDSIGVLFSFEGVLIIMCIVGAKVIPCAFSMFKISLVRLFFLEVQNWYLYSVIRFVDQNLFCSC